MTTWCARGASRMASRRRATKPGPGSTVRTATSATGSAAARGPPQRFWPSHRRLAGRRGEDHPPGSGLQDGGHDHADRLVHVAAPILDHDHGAVIEVRHSLVLLLAFLDYLDVHLLARNHDRFERVRQVVQVEDAHPFELCDPVQVVVVRHDGGVPLRCQLDQLHVDLGDLRNILVDEFDVDERLLLQQVEHLQAAPPAVSAQRITGVGDVLQLGQHEVRHQDLVAKETGLRDVHDPAVDDDTGVEQDTGVHWMGDEYSGRARRPQHQGHHLVSPVEPEGYPPTGNDEGDDGG